MTEEEIKSKWWLRGGMYIEQIEESVTEEIVIEMDYEDEDIDYQGFMD